jgi:iron complex outermembrane receptor protein
MIKKLPVTIVFLLAMSIQVFAQTVGGKVTSSDGAGPLPGVSVVLKGTNQGTVTDENGNYVIKVPAASISKGILSFSFIGFKNEEVVINNRSSIDVVLQDDAANLGEVVVTAFGVSKAQKALGYATSKINASELVKVGSPNLATALYGKAPGVRISAAPGGATSAVNITIRGVNSITGKNQPLIILDGVPIRDGEVKNNDYWNDSRQRGNGLGEINPEDIENLSILKGASAAALYGSEAVNGVLLITTKKGTKGRKGFSVDFNTNYSVDKVAYLPRYQNIRGAGAPISVSNGGQDAEGFIYYDTNGDGIKDTRGIMNSSINFGPKFDGKPVMSWDGVIRPYEVQKDNYKNLFQDAHNSQVNVAVSQATDAANVRFSVTRQDNEGVSLYAKNVRNIANLNTSFKLSKKIRTDVMVNYVNQNTKNRPYSTDRMMNNFTGMIGRFDNGDWYKNRYQTSQGYRFVTGASGQSLTPAENIIYNGFKSDIADYMWRVNKHNTTELSNRVIGSLTNYYQILPSLSLRGRISTDFTSLNTEDRQATEKPLAFGYTGYFGLTNEIYSIVYGDVLLTYNKKLTKDLDLTLMGGYTANKESSSMVKRNTNGGLSTENLFDVAASVNKADSETKRSSRVIDAILGTANLDYKGVLFLEGTLRRDRTSTMNPDNNSFIYPSVNSSFVFSQMWDMPSYIDYGKIRASWGIVGNYPDVYNANIAYNQNTLGTQQSGGQSVLYTTIPSAFGNDGIRPEQKHEYEFGLETKFFKNRIGLDISYYNAQIRDQILPLTLPNTSGAVSVLSNVGTLRNKGVEVGLTTTPFKRGGFEWNLGVNYAWNRNIVEKLANNSTELLHADYDGNAAQLRSVVGQPMGDLYAHGIELNSKGEKIVQADGLYKIDGANWIKVGNTQPKGVGGIFNNFTYKNFTLDMNTDFRIGGYVMPTGINWMISRGLLEESTQYMDKEHGGLSYYIADGKGIQTTAAAGPKGEVVYHDGMLLEGVTADGSANSNVVSQAYYYWNVYNWGGPQYSSSRYELYIQKASYWKMRELSLGYTLPSKLTSKIGASKVQISVFGRNLFFLYRNLKHLDPEILTAGSRWSQTINNTGTNPATRSVGIMLRSSF